MKILTNEQFSALKSKAESFDKVLEHIVANGDNITADAVTTEAILDMLKPSENSPEVNTGEMDGLKEQLQNLTSELETVQTQKNELEQEVNELKQLPVEEATRRIPTSAGQEENTNDVLAYIRKNKGDTGAIIGKIREIGLV